MDMLFPVQGEGGVLIEARWGFSAPSRVEDFYSDPNVLYPIKP